MTSLAADRHQVRIRNGGQSFLLDGEEIAGSLGGFVLAADAVNGAEVTLHVALTPEVEFDGLARVQVADAGSPQDVARFLAAIDPGELEKASLDREDNDGEHGLTRAMLHQLAEWAAGQ